MFEPILVKDQFQKSNAPGLTLGPQLNEVSLQEIVEDVHENLHQNENDLMRMKPLHHLSISYESLRHRFSTWIICLK